MYTCDMHTHTIASGHGTSCTIADMAKAAAAKGMTMLGITDHGPGTRAAGTVSYFRGLAHMTRIRSGIRLCCGAESNIMDFDGTLDLPDDVLDGLDYVIASIHYGCLKPGSAEANTRAYALAMRHPKVKIIGHPDDTRYPLDYERLADAASEYGVVLEVNNASLGPDGWRGDVRPNLIRMLDACRKRKLPVILSSDSHGPEHIGDFSLALALIRETGFPEELILNADPEKLKEVLGIREADPKVPRYRDPFGGTHYLPERGSAAVRREV
ncbi:MAG: phosphatase [Eubacteriales bacterium]|jgi:putative hydrolase